MKLLSRLAIALIVCLIAVPLLAPTTVADEGPYITLSRSSGVPGDAVTVTGHNFTAGVSIRVYYYLDGPDRTLIEEVTVKLDRSFTVTFPVPQSYTGVHEVRAYMGTILQATKDFRVRPGLMVNPEEGSVDSTVAVRGRGFGENETGIEVRYYVNGTDETVLENITADARGSWEANFKVPPSVRGAHEIDARGTESSFAAVEDATFEVTPGITIDRSSGTVGESITMTGGGFFANERNIKILFAGEAVAEGIEADYRGYWEEPFQIPEMPGGEYIVTAEGDFTLQTDVGTRKFEIKPGIILSPDEGHVGMNVTATGRGFAANEDVVIMYVDDNVATATTDDKGSFEVIFSVPESRHGGRQVTGEDTEGNKTEQAAIFTLESDRPPTPELISPRDGGRVGFASKVRPRFEWSEVEDVSGVYYSLQISASANVTAAGEFVHAIVTKERLVGSNYTLEKADALPHGTYYWIVQAVDGAENAGNWTAVYSFRAGRLPMWAFIVIIVFAVLGAGAAVYFYVIRKRMYL